MATSESSTSRIATGHAYADDDDHDLPPPPYYNNDNVNGSNNNIKKPCNSGTNFVRPPGGSGSRGIYDDDGGNRVNEPLLTNYNNTNDIDDDFSYGTTVSSSSIQVRHAFLAKVYTALFLQLLGTVIVGATLYTTSAKHYVQSNSYCFWLPLVASLISMIALYIYRQSYPANIFLLGTFTLAESLSVGTIVTFFDSQIVLLALVITLFLVLGLTLFAFQTKYDFSSMGGYLYGALLAFMLVGIATVFFPFSRAIDAIYAGVGVLLFSGILIYDTQMIMKRLSHEEWIIAVISLYLDIINLFMNILRLLNSARDN